LENYDTNFEKEIPILKKYNQQYFITKSKRLDPTNRLLKWKLLFPNELRIPFLMTYFNIDPKPKDFIHPNGIKKIKLIPLMEALCDDEILQLFIGSGVTNLVYEKLKIDGNL